MSNLGQIEDNIFLNLPHDLAVKFRAKMKNHSLSKFTLVPDPDSVDHQNIIRLFKVEIDDFPPLKGTLVDLPCVTELQKTRDRKFYYKTGDVSQMLMVSLESDATPIHEKVTFAKNPAGLDRLRFQMDSGLTAPSHGCFKRWDLERAVCVCENQEGESCTICGALPKKQVEIASKKLLSMMIARPTENFKIVEKELDMSQSIVRLSNANTPASLSVRRTPGKATPAPSSLIRNPSPQVVPARPAIAPQPTPPSAPQSSQATPETSPPKPGPTKTIQKQKSEPVQRANAVILNKIKTYEMHQLKLANKQQELNLARKKQGLSEEKRKIFEEKYQECIKKGFAIKARIFELKKSLTS